MLLKSSNSSNSFILASNTNRFSHTNPFLKGNWVWLPFSMSLLSYTVVGIFTVNVNPHLLYIWMCEKVSLIDFVMRLSRRGETCFFCVEGWYTNRNSGLRQCSPIIGHSKILRN